ncbi:CGNR zinc finger domain-containing protein [Streptomyces sp. NPDC089424]|uniref:CGNR zinc finger domain-containing protein n=1 Tax=Streptomyces sp. NPDC089424 TaxID=3365917 RepID=UPI00380430F4
MTGTRGSEAAREVPATAAAIVDLLNSRPHSTAHLFPEALEDPATASGVLSPFAGPDAGPPSPERLAGIRALREILLRLVTARDAAEAADGWADLSDHAASVALRHEFSAPGRVRTRQVAGDPVLGAITLAVAELVDAGTWSRLRVCANERCGHAFYDTTRSRTQRWHSYEVCGNRKNVAAYRARKKADGAKADGPR